MTNAEITAYMAGAALGEHMPISIEDGKPVALIPMAHATDELKSAQIRLGDQAFFYWMLRGAVEASTSSEP